MDVELAQFLSRCQLLAEETAAWDNGRMPLGIAAYLCRELPPLDYVTSVRAIVLRDDSVLVVRDAENSYHIIPGGRREVGETLEATLQREVLEETGWTINQISLLGFIHFRHLAPKPVDYAYPYPDFLQLVYAANAVNFNADAKQLGQYELESGFRSIDEINRLSIAASQQAFLNAALKMKE